MDAQQQLYTRNGTEKNQEEGVAGDGREVINVCLVEVAGVEGAFRQ
jgi:hypothetical protein